MTSDIPEPTQEEINRLITPFQKKLLVEISRLALYLSLAIEICRRAFHG